MKPPKPPHMQSRAPARYCAQCGSKMEIVERKTRRRYNIHNGNLADPSYDLVCPKKRHLWGLMFETHDIYPCSSGGRVTGSYAQ